MKVPANVKKAVADIEKQKNTKKTDKKDVKPFEEEFKEYKEFLAEFYAIYDEVQVLFEDFDKEEDI